MEYQTVFSAIRTSPYDYFAWPENEGIVSTNPWANRPAPLPHPQAQLHLQHAAQFPHRPPPLPLAFHNHQQQQQQQTLEHQLMVQQLMSPFAMSGGPVRDQNQQQHNQPSEEELAELQKLSNEYEPEFTGPLVGERQTSAAITTEYASADPVYQAKTRALPQKYSHYRTVRGDGRCGWRAIAFGYFETLIRFGDINNLLEEEARIRSLDNVLNAAGFDSILYEDFVAETIGLLRKLVGVFSTGTADATLLESFNNEELQNYIITHLKTLTAAWMKRHEAEYEPWLLGQSVDEYTASQVLPIGSEIDHVGLSALKDVLLAPAGIALEVLYLDRSEGTEVNVISFEAGAGSSEIGDLRLLYRPGHYDILYKAEDFPQPSSVTTYLQYDLQPNLGPVVDICASNVLADIPGMSFANDWLPGGDSAPQSSPCFDTQVVGSSPTATPPYVCKPRMQQLPYRSPEPAMQYLSTVPISAEALAMSHDPISDQDASGLFRPSMYELRPHFVRSVSQKPFQTSIFQNSYYNTAHFLNPDFQPEEWRPETDLETKSPRRRSSA